MRKLFYVFLVLVFAASSSLLFAQQQKRTSQIGSEKYRAIIENFKPAAGQTDNIERGVNGTGTLIYSENFDGYGPIFPPGWSGGGNGTACEWAVDATPTPPGFFSADYSLNYNNGVDFDCGWNWGMATSPLIDVSGQAFNVSFMFYYEGENDYPFWDLTYLTVYDESFNVMEVFYVNPVAQNSWHLQSFSIPNYGNHQKVYLEFYFDTGDEIYNNFKGPFIDNLVVTGTTQNQIPVSNWAIILGVMLIGAFIVVRYRRRLA
ncbi:MAG: hypothetical protein L3J31_00500 [Bacteroidales bacterium]|nr:hypothetical protein [Bacteroidales bacterium]